MKSDLRVIVCCVLLLTACAGGPRVASSRVSPDQVAIVRADSEAVVTILRAIQYEYAKYPSASEMKLDVRADAEASSFASVTGERPTADSTLLGLVAESRRRILKTIGVPPGEPLRFNQCAGMLALPRDTTNLWAGCPKVGHFYIAINLPHAGEYPKVRDLTRRRGKPLRTYVGEVWSVVVSEVGVGPRGGSASWSVYVLTRDPKGALVVGEKILFGAID